MLPALTPRPLESLIHFIRDRKVILDADLARLYEVETKALSQAVRRNPQRFPEAYVFRLTARGTGCSKVTICDLRRHDGTRSALQVPAVRLHQHGVVMLSAVLNSPRAIEMSLHVVNAFIRMRELLASNQDLATRIERLETGQERTTCVIEVLAEDIAALGSELESMRALPEPAKRAIGFPQSA